MPELKVTPAVPTPASDPGFGVYIHWPFCASKCPYCDFNSHVRQGGIDEARFLAGYRRELAWHAERAPGRSVGSIFFGGGTPSLMAPATVAALIDAVARHWQLEPDAEITLEANPSSVEADRFAGYRTAGVNRVSLGVQSLRAPALAALGRLHSVEEAKAAIAIAQRTFERASFDLIYARPKQTVMEWRAELTEALGLARGHLSLYQLTIEPDTPFAALHRAGKLVTPPAQAAHDLYVLTQELTTAAGLPAYEISNHAAPGQQSRHNRLYWRYGEYAGIGAGAHGRLVIDGTRTALSSERKPETWLARVEADGEAFVEKSPLSLAEQADELLLMGLRIEEGVDLDRLAVLTGRRIEGRAIARLEELGMLAVLAKTPAGPSRIAATADGRMVLNSIVTELAARMHAPAPEAATY